MKLWEKGLKFNQLVNDFTVGNDRTWDLYLAESDIQGSMAHAHMLSTIGFLSPAEVEQLRLFFLSLLDDIQNQKFSIDPEMEDIHSQIEYMITQKLGDTGKRIHVGRSRNDQVLVDLKLFYRKEILELANTVMNLFTVLVTLSETHKNEFLPGYTHLQVAMPSSFGLWFGAYAESLGNDLESLFFAFKLSNRNPLGSAAGYGTSLPINRELTTRLLGFEDMDINSAYTQMSRGKTELGLIQALSNLALTFNKMAMDICLYINQDFGFIKLPDEFTTGSSIMPHKKNPDIFELIRGKTNVILGVQTQITQIYSNLPSGYHREFQLTKDLLFPAIKEMHSILQILIEVLPEIEIIRGISSNPEYKYIYSVDRVHEKVAQGTPFRNAYQEVAEEIKNNTFQNPQISRHTHTGSLGNLSNAQIQLRVSKTFAQFPFSQIGSSLNQLFQPFELSL
jgi:argininosuccinate lyase